MWQVARFLFFEKNISKKIKIKKIASVDHESRTIPADILRTRTQIRDRSIHKLR